MSDRSFRHRDRGFTLVEMIVVVVLMGLVTAAISFAALAMLRTAPQAGEHTNHANVQSSLLSWLSRDLASAPAHNYTAAAGGMAIANGGVPVWAWLTNPRSGQRYQRRFGD